MIKLLATLIPDAPILAFDFSFNSIIMMDGDEAIIAWSKHNPALDNATRNQLQPPTALYDYGQHFPFNALRALGLEVVITVVYRNHRCKGRDVTYRS